MPDLIADVLGGNTQAAARLISLVEDGDPDGYAILRALHARTGRAYVVGITGPPGAGKSTLVDTLTAQLRAAATTVAVVAVDPTSPFTGGALLGDRIRMQDHVGDPGVYIRSMGSRGHLGGVAEATPKAIMILDAIGLSHVFVETVGVGQAEVEIVESADTTIVVVNPGWGDSVQANKAGLLEIGDILVVNKADRDGVADTMRDLEQMLDLGGQRAWRPPVLATVATVGEGIGSVWQAVQDHRSFLESTGRLNEARSARLRQELHRAVVAELFRRAEDAAEDDRFATLTAEVDARRMDPWTAARRLLDGG